MKIRTMSSSLRNSEGFSLVELMIVVVIIGILTSIAYPSYEDYVLKGRIAEATSILSSKRARIEQYFQDNRTYTGAPECANDSSSGQFFDFSCTTETDTAFTLEAAGKGVMSEFTYTLDQSGARSSSTTHAGWSGSATCWVTKKGGGC